MEEIVELLLRQGKKRKYPQSPPKKGKENREPKIRVIRLMPRPTRLSIPSSSLSLE